MMRGHRHFVATLMALIPLSDPVPPSRSPRNGWAVLALGFRPFYLLGSSFAVLAIPAWLLVLSGRLEPAVLGLWWHAHEMLFGFAGAVVVGFLFTAGRNWTGLDTPKGVGLAALALLWLAGRLGMVLDGGAWTATVDSLFLPAAAGALARVFIRANSRRNHFIVGLLLAMAAANVGFHLGRLGVIAIDPMSALHAALGVLIVLETIIAGRVVPSFTAAALRPVKQWQSPRLNQSAIALTGIALLAWAFSVEGAGWLLALAAAMQLVRSAGWNPWAARREPLLWVLHLAHGWVVVGLALLAAAQWNAVPVSAGVHALTIGTTAGLIIGMITRTALGHTGRRLVVGRVETLAYGLVHLAALVRVVTLVALPAMATAGIHAAAAMWTVAFLLYLGRYGPYLVRPRLDGQPG